MPRILKYLRSKNELRTKGNTMKKNAPGAQTNDSQETHGEAAPRSGDEANTLPLEYYTPRPSPKSFVVRETRKVSNNSSPTDSLESQGSRADHEDVAATKSDVPAGLMGAQSSRASGSPTPSPGSPSTQVANTTPPVRASAIINGASTEPHPRAAYKLILGRQDPTSSYFTRRYFRLNDLAASQKVLNASNDTLHHVPELDPQAFDMFKIWLHTRKITPWYLDNVEKEHKWMASWPLMNAHILGCIIEEPDFADRVMDVLAERLAPLTCPDADTIAHIFALDREGVSKALKRLVIDRFIDSPEVGRNCLNIASMPKTFCQGALQTILQRFDRDFNPEAHSCCRYHIHGPNEACYKTRMTPVDVMKEQKLAEARALSTKDAEVVVANMIKNGIKSIDWEQRKANANRALQEEMRRSWVGFRRLEDGGRLVRSARITKTSPNGTFGEEGGTRRSDETWTNHDKAPLTNGTTPTFDLTRTPNNSPVLHSHAGTSTGTAIPTALSTAHGNNELSGFPTVASVPKPPDNDPRNFTLVELPGSTVYELPQSTNTVQNYKPGINRVPDTGGRTSQTLMVMNGAQEIGMVKPGLSNSTFLSRSDVEMAVTGYEGGVKIPGAYPESKMGV